MTADTVNCARAAPGRAAAVMTTVARTVAHLIIAGGRAGDVNRRVAATAIRPGVPGVCAEVGYADPVATPSFPPVVLRNGVVVEDPLSAVLGLLKGSWHFDVSDPSRSASVGEADLRLANPGGARISAAEIEAGLEARGGVREPPGTPLLPAAPLRGGGRGGLRALTGPPHA